ncbi:MAG: 4-diphosphocytidyl-2-C-methyl-D-erythritol kinase [Bacteroidia bacterium]|nr:MAG: 4-diphosphocytidyl-2-C-methyl-D-erythritol kinase [Bacteroidia bacterium]
MKTRAYGKINLGLRVLRKRPDGYHDIETVFHQVDIADELTFRLHERDVIFSTTHPDLANDRTNLCLRAAHLLRDLTGIQDGAEIMLAKNIPLGAGLGGGSADAASTLKSLRALWNLDISDDELRTLAVSLGSDVPFFLNGGSAYATSRGEHLEPLRLGLPYWIIVVTPPIHVSTATAYNNLRRTSEHMSLVDFKSVLLNHLHEPEVLASKLVNDFEPVVFGLHPEIRDLKQAMLRHGAEVALLTGSGSSVFALTKSEATAHALMRNLEPLGRVFVTKPFFSPTHQPTPPFSEA